MSTAKPGAARRAVLVSLSTGIKPAQRILDDLAASGIRPGMPAIRSLLAGMDAAGLIRRRPGLVLKYSITAAGLKELGGPTNPVPPPPNPPPEKPPPVIPPVIPPTDPVAAELLALHNAHRRSVGVPPLAAESRLQRAAQLHSEDQARTRRMGHTGSDGSDVAARVGRQGYPWRALGENAAAGQKEARIVMGGWLGSPGHLLNIENTAYTEFGGAVAWGTDGLPYWTAVFAAPGATRGIDAGDRPGPDTPEWGD